MTLTAADDPRHGTLNGYNHHRCRCDRCADAKNRWAVDNYKRNPDKRPVRKPETLADGDPRHGTNGYNNHNCRCEVCREAQRQAKIMYREGRKDQPRAELAPDDPRHGTRNGYGNLGCRCEPCKSAGRARDAEYRAREDRVEAKRESDRRYREANPGKQRARQAQWLATDEGRVAQRAAWQRRRALQKAAECGCCTTENLRAVYDRDANRCAYCGGEGAHLDHIVPLSQGGRHCVSNLRVACVWCNSSKHARSLDEFLADLTARGVEIMPNATAPGLPCTQDKMRQTGWGAVTADVQDPWGMSA